MSSRKLLTGVTAGVVAIGAAFVYFLGGEPGVDAGISPSEVGQAAQGQGIKNANPVQRKDPAQSGTVAEREAPSAADSTGKGGNPKARRIRAALDTPAHAFLARTSPAWVQARRVLSTHAELEWVEKLEDLLQDISEARRDLELEGAFLLARQNALLESLLNADFPPDLKADIQSPLAVLAERIEAYAN
jgi:hypothetical protein